MAQLPQGQRLTLPITATQGYYFSTSGAAIVRVTPSNGGAFVVTIGTDETDVGWFGFDASLELIAQSGVLTYNTTPSALTAVQLGDQRDSDAVDIALSVNKLSSSLDFNSLAFQVSVIQPTVAVSAAGAGTSIPSSVRIQPMKSLTDATKFQVVGDPNYRIFGVPSNKAILDSGDIFRCDFLTGGNAQAARWRPYVEFSHTGQQFELFVRSTGTTTKFRIWVNGKPLTSTMQTITTAAGQRHRILVDFGSVGVRDIRFEMVEWSFGGVFVEPFGSITAAGYDKKSFAVISDSTGAGASGVNAFEAWPWLAANYLGMDCANLSIGGSGYIAAPSFQSRLQDVIDANPDYLFITGGQNDKAGNTTEAIMDAFRLFCDSVEAALPPTKIIVGGVHMTTQNVDATGAPLEAALRAECLLRGYPFISQRDPQNLVATLPVWANGVSYKFGDQIKQNDLPFVCTVEHVSSGSFNAANFRCSAVFSGTGRVGATAGNGNLDICMTSDGVHFSAEGMMIQGINYAEQVGAKV